jgi:hypothetical protein
LPFRAASSSAKMEPNVPPRLLRRAVMAQPRGDAAIRGPQIRANTRDY